jgi:predicted nucleotidyltransferase
MRTSLDHLPAHKQRELERVVQLVFEEFEDSFALARREWKKQGRILKVVLYGSYARGGWVDEPHTAKGYKSDYDLLIIVNDARLTDRVKYWSRLDERLMREYGVTGTLKTPVNFIVHTLGEVNDGLAHGRYFFIDVARDGIALYQADEEERSRRLRWHGSISRSGCRAPSGNLNWRRLQLRRITAKTRPSSCTRQLNAFTTVSFSQ